MVPTVPDGSTPALRMGDPLTAVVGTTSGDGGFEQALTSTAVRIAMMPKRVMSTLAEARQNHGQITGTSGAPHWFREARIRRPRGGGSRFD